MNRFIGQPYSTSPNCGMVQLVGGPYDGQSGLFDHNQYDSICFCEPLPAKGHVYKPENKGFSWRYIYQSPSPAADTTSENSHG